MKIGNFDTDRRTLVIAEIGNNHEGDYHLAEEMIGLAAEAGADAVKFQTFLTEHYLSTSDQNRFNMLKKFELSYDEFERLKETADKQDLIFLSTPFDIQSAVFLNSLVPAFKIASGDNTFYPLIRTVAEFGKPILLSCGLIDFHQIGYSKAFIENIWRSNGTRPELAILHCVASYPVPKNEANLLSIKTLGDRFEVTIGYSDHTLGIDAALLSVAIGARIVEKHFTVNKNYSDFRDHQLSADPDDFKRLVQQIREIEVMLGTGAKQLFDCEKEVSTAVRRSIVAARPLKTGSVVQFSDITWVRPSGGIPPGEEESILGRRLKQDMEQGQAFSQASFY